MAVSSRDLARDMEEDEMINNPTTGSVKPKLKIVSTEERGDRLVHVYENGLERDARTGHIVKPAKSDQITSESAHLLLRKRQEKAAALLRQRITEVHNGIMPSPVKSSAAAFAESGAMLYEQIVANSEAYPRDRMEAWEKLGKYAEVLTPDLKRGSDDVSNAINATAAALNAQAAASLERIWRDIEQKQRGEVVDGTVSDVE